MTVRALDPPCDPDGVSPYLLIGTALPLYREVLSGALQALRPDVAVRTVAPEELEATVSCLRPWLVICSATSAVIEELAPAWVLLYPDERRHSVVSVAGARRTIPHPTIDELVRLVDTVWDAPPTAAR